MKIRNKDAFSEEVNIFLEKYYSYILKQEKEYYESLPQDIYKLEKNISRVERKIDIAEEVERWFGKQEEGSLFDFFLGDYITEIREYIDEKIEELDMLYDEYDEKKKFFDLYTNLSNNGILINYSDNCCYEVEPYDGKLYATIKKQ